MVKAVFDNLNLIWVKPGKIKDLILEKGYPQRVITGKGDSKPKRCYLIPTKEIYSISNKVESVHETQRIKTI